MCGQLLAEEAIDHAAIPLAIAMTALELKCGGAGRSADKADQRRAKNDDRKRNIEKEDAHKCGRRERAHHVVLERALADADDRLQHDRENRGLEPEKQRRNRRHVAVAGIDVAERHDGDEAGEDEEDAGHDAAERAVHQPADIGRELLRLGPGQQHAIVERVQETALRNPALLLDQDAVHHRDLAGGTAEAQHRDAKPDPERLAQRHAVSRRVLTALRDREFSHAGPPSRLQPASCGFPPGDCDTRHRARRTSPCRVRAFHDRPGSSRTGPARWRTGRRTAGVRSWRDVSAPRTISARWSRAGSLMP